MSSLPITTCVDGAGTVNGAGSGLADVGKYVAPTLCVGTWVLTSCQDQYQEQLAAENLNISGATLNVFKLLGVHEQGLLIDLVGSGHPLNGSANAFNSGAGSFFSPQTGMAVLTAPAWLGYDFGVVMTSFGQPANAPGQPAAQHITSLRITQPTDGKRALQVRVERSTGGYKLDPLKIQFTGVGAGSISGFTVGAGSVPGSFMLVALNPTQFSVYFTSDTTVVVGTATVGVRFNSMFGSFTIVQSSPFAVNDMFTLPIELDWYRVDVVNLPDTAAPALIRIKQSSASRYWRIVPLSFSGVVPNSAWEVSKLELFDYQATTLDDVQDSLFLENRDRDYAKSSVAFKVAYTPFDAISDLSKFGFQVADVYTFTTVFSTMVLALGRPIVVGDVLEVPSELQYDHNLNPVRKFLEVTDVSWSAEGYTTSWRPIMYKFQASQLIPSQEHRDLLGTVDTQKYVIDDSEFFNGIQQISTGALTAHEVNTAEANLAVPETGTNVREVASGTNRFMAPGSYDGVDLYVEDGLPPDGQPYTEGFKLPDVSASTDGQFFRLNYDPRMNIAPRLYKFNSVKMKWLYVETDRRTPTNSLRPPDLEMFEQPTVLSLTSKVIP